MNLWEYEVRDTDKTDEVQRTDRHKGHMGQAGGVKNHGWMTRVLKEGLKKERRPSKRARGQPGGRVGRWEKRADMLSRLQLSPP